MLAGLEKLCTFALALSDYPPWVVIVRNLKVFQPSLKCLFSIEIEPQGYFYTSRKPSTDYKSDNMLKEKVFRLSVSLYLGFKAPKLVKVKAYKRIRNGKVEKVRSHYRNVEGRLVVPNELHR